jgi:hypothetical protein
MRMQEIWSRDLILFATLKIKGQVFPIQIAISTRERHQVDCSIHWELTTESELLP